MTLEPKVTPIQQLDSGDRGGGLPRLFTSLEWALPREWWGLKAAKDNGFER